MNKKRYLALIIFIVIVFIVPAIVLAQNETPPRPAHDYGWQIPNDENEMGVLKGFPGNKFQTVFEEQTALSSQTSESSLTLGEPGLSFRYVESFGIGEVGYETDKYHLNAPGGLYIDSNDNLYVVEDRGYRLLRYNSSGTNTLELGIPGFCNDTLDPTGFCVPQDIAVDSSGNIFVATGNRVVKFNSDGIYQTQLPIPDSYGSWSSGVDTTHFRTTGGVAFDKINERLFVSDRNNHRVQVYTMSGGLPIYSATIGVTGEPGTDNSHFYYPERMTVDNLGRLFVVDSRNYRVQRCTFSSGWTCEPFGPTMGSYYPRGISNDASGNIYISDSDYGRVIKCNPSGTCSDLATSLLYSEDVSVDSAGNLFLGAYGHSVIRKYDSSGNFISNYLGEWHSSYSPYGQYIYSPNGLVVAEDGSLYVTEIDGHRLLKFNSSGIRQWQIGDPGAWGDEDGQFNTPDGNPAISASGLIYVSDSNNNRIQIFDENGNFISSFGSTGSGDNQFDYPTGIAISPINGDIYIADAYNSRIQVYNSSLSYLGTIGVTGVSGSDDKHFDLPFDVAVDGAGNIYVADYSNYRIQKCSFDNSSYSCTTFVGVTGYIDDGFDYLEPISVEVDKHGRVYVTDQWNNRIQVFDATGAYLTTIGGGWGSRTGNYRIPTGLALDEYGNVYVSDYRNNRVQKFAPGIPYWAQKNINGFGDPERQVSAVAVYGGDLYVGTYKYASYGAHLWKMDENGNWSRANVDGFGKFYNIGIDHIVEFQGKLYAGIWSSTPSEPHTQGGEIWRYPSASSGWESVIDPGFGDIYNGEIMRMGVFDNQIYAATWSYTTTHGTEIWRSPSGDYGSWSRIVENGLGDPTNETILSMEVVTNTFYVSTYSWDRGVDIPAGAEIWRTTNGVDWSKVTDDCFNQASTCYEIGSLKFFNDYLYAGTALWDASTSTSPGGQIWRCPISSACDEESDWEQLTLPSSLGKPSNYAMRNFIVFQNYLYITASNELNGLEVWRTPNGEDWMQIGFAGFGDSNNGWTYFDNTISVYENKLYLGTTNWANGGEVWQFLDKWVFLPMILR